MSMSQTNSKVRGRGVSSEPMARHCSWRTGGPAERYFEPADIEDLIVYLRQCDRDEALTWIGLGSNVLIRDGGLSGTVISTAKSLNRWEWRSETSLYIECGVTCARIAKEVAKRSLYGGSFLAGIPGTIGGALAMNAGAFGRETWMIVESADLVDRRGRRYSVDVSEIEFGYRYVSVPSEHWFVSAILNFNTEPLDIDEPDIRDLLGRRNATQPIGTASCGSVFKNPPHDFAGRLIEAAGLKGKRIGGCYVSDKHANFIINDGHATSADIEALITHVRDVVQAELGVTLETEVRIIGNSATGVVLQ